jgi:hypothetical protein
MPTRMKSSFLGSEMPLFIAILLIGLTLGFLITHQVQAQQSQLQAQQRTTPPIEISVNTSGGDDRFTRPPRPQRWWNNGPEFPPRGGLLPPDGGRLINMPTQGLPESYQSVGLLTTGDGKLLPLYGRRVASRSDRFNYYTRTDTYNPVPLPINYKRRDCQDSVGCDELFNGDEVVVSPLGATAKATLYQFDGPTYIPSII